MSSSVSPVRPGDVLAGKYRVEEVLGSGGFGIVVAAVHVQMGSRVALKFLLPQVLEMPEVVARFLREAKAATKLSSEHVVRVTDVGTLESGARYMVMELLHGVDLGKLLEAKGPLPIDDAIDFVMQALQAIAEAHAKGIVHRDLKPSNLFLTTRADGTALVKVLDFGIAKTLAESEEEIRLTQSATMVGSPMYMSPEQVRSARSVDARTDLWALGVTLFELLSGCIPFQATTPTAVIAAIVSDPPRSLRGLRAEIHEDLQATIEACLAKDVDARIANVGDLAARLAPFGSKDAALSLDRILGIAGRGAVTTSLLPAASGKTPPDKSGGEWADTEIAAASPARRGASSMRFVVAGLVVVLVAVIGYFAARRSRDADVTSTGRAGIAQSASVAPPPSASVPTASSDSAISIAVPVDSSSAKPKSTSPPPKTTKPPADRGGDLGRLIDERQ